MAIPGLRNIEVEGQLRGVARASALVCVVGISSAGTPLQIALDSRVTAITARVGFGPMPELAAQVAASGASVAYCKIAGTPAEPSAVVHDGTGAVMTVDGDAHDAYGVSVRVVKGGTIGVPGIKLEHSINGGVSYQPPVSIGASDSFALPGTGLTVEFAAGSLVAGETYAFDAAAPTWDIADVLAALEVVKRSRLPVDCVALAGAASATDVMQFSNAITALKPFGKHIWGLAEVRMPDPDETDAVYATAIDAAFTGTTNNVGVAAWAARVPSAITGIVQRRTPLYGSINDLTPETVSENAAAIDGHAANAFLTDEAGNLIEHNALYDESLSDRFLTYRTWPGDVDGVYLTWARLLSTPGSSFQLILHRRIVNRAEQITDRYMAGQVHLPVLAKADGTIAESAAKRIETGLTASLRAGLSGDISNLLYVLDRTKVITTVPSQIEGDLYVQPFGYPDTITTRIILTATVQPV